MTRLVTEPNLTDPDGVYEKLIAAHDGLSVAASRRLNAKLILLLANHIGDAQVIEEALRAARMESGQANRMP